MTGYIPIITSDQLRSIVKTINALKLQVDQLDTMKFLLNEKIKDLEEEIRELRISTLKGGNVK